MTPESIRAHAPNTSGVFGISNDREWIYIGESDNIQLALLAHLHDQATGFVFEICDRAGRFSRQDRLIFEYEPTCNRTVLKEASR